ncbi:unnamed protein product [Medioppia subpectinata]|uniref:ILEI/PANDER domain-containing protein n=1 Tax=Medioppia subpectinata TaxID=1979941 RepID=A0A7R9KUT8_9ACAR|nr:unnamed protein product [Medioppia subpectinata]CAG2109856.1 unnamed protein product [Medioppia subpectinata]
MVKKWSLYMTAKPGLQFLYWAKWALAVIIVWIITLLVREVEFTHQINEPTVAAPNDDEIFLDISQTVDLPFQQDLSFSISDGIKSGKKVANCGLPMVCQNNQFAVHLFTGRDNQIYPKLCIDGNYVLDKGLNGCGRGINLVIIDNMTRSILRVSNFDTYEKDSQPLETLLLTLRVGDIVIMISFDEPTSKLSKVAKLLLHQMGSNWAQNLIYRSSWYIITQKGIDGYTPYENLNLPNTGGWADSHEIRICVPLKIKGLSVQPDPILDRNPKRAEFCAKYYIHFPLFCEGNVVNDPLIAARILKFLPISGEIVRTPIIVLTAQTYAQNVYLSLTLETLIRQPGITPRNVIVFYNSISCPSIAYLAEVFDFMSNDLSDFGDDLDEVRRTTEMLFPDAKAFILIDMNTILAPDFLPFMGQLLPFLLTKGSDIESISAWNDNGFESVSNDSSVVYRVNAGHYKPRFAALFRRGFAFNISPNFLWSFVDNLNSNHDNNIIIPDVSRVLYVNPDLSSAPNEVQDEEEVLIKAFELGDGLAFYAQSIGQMVNKSTIASDVRHLEALLVSRSNNTKHVYSISCDSELQCRQLCGDLGLANCLPHLVIPNIGGVIK